MVTEVFGISRWCLGNAEAQAEEGLVVADTNWVIVKISLSQDTGCPHEAGGATAV